MAPHIKTLSLADKLQLLESLRAKTEKRMAEIMGRDVELEAAMYACDKDTIDAALELEWPSTANPNKDVLWVSSPPAATEGTVTLFPTK